MMFAIRRYIVFLFFCFFLFSAPVFADQDSLISVQYIGVNPSLENVRQYLRPAETLRGDLIQSVSFQIVGAEQDLESAFLLRSNKPVLLEFFIVQGLSDQGDPLPGTLLAEYKVQKGDVYLFRHLVPEGMPNLLLCAQDESSRYYWHPRFSGMDDSLELDQGFVHFMGQ